MESQVGVLVDHPMNNNFTTTQIWALRPALFV
jgi:hypothetical protein